jgi:CDP-diglyceride synthetase
LIYSTRKGIKAWIITFGALVVIGTIIAIIIIGIYKYIRIKKQNKKSVEISQGGGF